MTRKLHFTFQPERYEDGSGSDHWIAGIYKITKYDAIASGPYMRRAFYRGYFIPVGWKNWGNGVDTVQHRTLSAAQRACQQHADRFERPHEYDRIERA